MSFKRLYIFTGKGGVGKTTLSLAFTKTIQNKNKKVKLTYFKTSKLEEQTIQYQEVSDKAKQLGIETLGLDLLESAEAYIGKKLGSKTIAHWVVKTPFFKSLINMIPGFNYLIFMGQVLEFLKADPDLILVLDSPSSGHALTMFEATKNFNQIFQKGSLYDDTTEMLNMLKSPEFVQLNLVTLPAPLPLQESQDFIKQVKAIENFEIKLICNYSFQNFKELELPNSLQTKLKNELEALAKNEIQIDQFIPFSLALNVDDLTKELLPSMESLV